MDEEWKEIQNQALVAGDDFVAICTSLRRLGRSLGGSLYVPRARNTPVPITEPRSFQPAFDKYLELAKRDFIKNERRVGKAVPASFDSYLQKARLHKNEKTKRLNYVRLQAWRKFKGPLFELLCLLAELDRLRPVGDLDMNDVFSPRCPITVEENGQTLFMWVRPTISETISGLGACPDIVLTTSEVIHGASIRRIVECKFHNELNAQHVRAEFGKASDLEVKSSYNIVSYHPTPRRLKDAASRLGIDLWDFGLHTELRDEYIAGRLDVGKDLADKLEESRRNEHFLALWGEDS